jgi:hypothetical protein
MAYLISTKESISSSSLCKFGYKIFLLQVLMGIIGIYSLIFDPTKRNFGGMMAGLMVNQMFRMKFI